MKEKSNEIVRPPSFLIVYIVNIHKTAEMGKRKNQPLIDSDSGSENNDDDSGSDLDSVRHKILYYK